MVGLAVLLATPPPAQPPVVVVLQSTGKDPARGRQPGGQLQRRRPRRGGAADHAGGRARTDRVLELWWAPPEGKPTSLGLIRADGVTVLSRGQLPGGLRGSGIDHMAVSVEPPGGSPTGQPTGPVVFYGKLQL